MRRFGRLRLEPLETRLVLDAGPIYITELMADNETFLPDGDGDFSDWIELHNSGGQPADVGAI